MSYEQAMAVFALTKGFPREEIYSLTGQIRRASRSVPANIVEGWAKRRYKDVFLRHLTDALGSCEEVKVWLDFSIDCKYLDDKTCLELAQKYDEVAAMLFALVKNWQKF